LFSWRAVWNLEQDENVFNVEVDALERHVLIALKFSSHFQ
jgi:hypothetical protein